MVLASNVDSVAASVAIIAAIESTPMGEKAGAAAARSAIRVGQ